MPRRDILRTDHDVLAHLKRGCFPPFAQRTALFIGDDVTDESVFAALPALGGHGYPVGRKVAGVEGTFDSPQDVHDWLRDMCEQTA